MTSRMIFWDVDTQVDFMDPDGKLYVPGAEALADNLDRLTGFARDLEIPVVASADEHRLSDAEIVTESPDGQTTFPPHCMHDSPGAERIDATRLDYPLVLGRETWSRHAIRRGLENPWPRVLIKKNELDVFSNPATEIVLELLDPEQIVVYGVALDFCVRKTVEGLFERGHSSLVLVTDATAPIDADAGEELLDRWRQQGVTLATTDSLAVRLDQIARSAAL